MIPTRLTHTTQSPSATRLRPSPAGRKVRRDYQNRSSLRGRQTPGSATRDQGPPPTNRRAAASSGETEVPLTKGTPRKQRRRRPQGRTGANRMTGKPSARDSAQRRLIDRHRSDARNFLTHHPPLVPHPADRLPLCCIVPLRLRAPAQPPRPLRLLVFEIGGIGARSDPCAQPPTLPQRTCSRIR